MPILVIPQFIAFFDPSESQKKKKKQEQERKKKKNPLPFMFELEHKLIAKDTTHIKSITTSCQFFLCNDSLFFSFPLLLH